MSKKVWGFGEDGHTPIELDLEELQAPFKSKGALHYSPGALFIRGMVFFETRAGVYDDLIYTRRRKIAEIEKARDKLDSEIEVEEQKIRALEAERDESCVSPTTTHA